MSMIAPATLAAYRETHYQVYAAPPFTLHIGQESEPLHTLYRIHGSTCAAFITACNPHSVPLTDDENAARQRALAAELDKRGYMILRGAGRAPQGNWSEPSFLVLGLARDEAKTLGECYEQNALVWCGADAIPKLLLLR